MLTFQFALLISSILFQEVPYKAKDQFDVQLKYEFRQRPPDNTQTVVYEAVKSNTNAGALLPYLTLNITVIDAVEATKIRFSNNRNSQVTTKKVKNGSNFPLIVGYTDDAKDRVTANEYTLTFLDDAKNAISRIVIFIDEDGTFLINSENRGKL